jgi:hypothetical protein
MERGSASTLALERIEEPVMVRQLAGDLVEPLVDLVEAGVHEALNVAQLAGARHALHRHARHGRRRARRRHGNGPRALSSADAPNLGVRLVGNLPDWVSAKHVILEMLRRHGADGGLGRPLDRRAPPPAVRSSPLEHAHAHFDQERTAGL